MYNSQDPVGTSVTLHSVAVTNAELWRRKILLCPGVTFDFLKNLSCQTLVTFLQCNEIKASRVLLSGKGSLSQPLRSHIYTHTHMFSVKQLWIATLWQPSSKTHKRDSYHVFCTMQESERNERRPWQQSDLRFPCSLPACWCFAVLEPRGRILFGVFHENDVKPSQK